MADLEPPHPGHCPSVRAAAWEAHKVGLLVYPATEDGAKRPDGPWLSNQKERATDQQVAGWYPTSGTRTGLGTICGRVSGNLECLEYDERDVYEAFVEAARKVGLGDIVDQVEAGYCEDTPRGGTHWLYRCDEIEGNIKLAQRREGDDIKVLIETRGEGGYCINAPSHGGVHPNGKPYVRRSGNFKTIATITPEQRRALFELASSFDEMPKPIAADFSGAGRTQGTDRPGDRFNREATWEEIVNPHRWTFVYERGEVSHWRRPGKDQGISATTNHEGSDLLYVYSTSTPFEAERGINKFSAYTTLNECERNLVGN